MVEWGIVGPKDPRAPGRLNDLRHHVLNSLLYFPSREVIDTPRSAGLDFSDVWLETADGERLQGWWIGARRDPIGHVLLCHGNAGNIGERVPHAAVLSAAGFDVLLFDYRGYGNSSGTPSEHGTYRDARAALGWMLEQPDVDPAGVLYLGESLGGAVALELALEHPPAGLVLVSTFSGIRAMGEHYYSFIPTRLVPDAYPSLRRIRELQTPLLILHGEQDEVVPLAHGRELFEAAAEPKRLRTFPGLGHNDLFAGPGPELAQEVAAWTKACT